MNKLLVICGPTATGKTSLGIRLAKKFDGEIISADSRQVYRGMDIGTGKDLPVGAKRQKKGFYLINGVCLWGYDIVDPKKSFSVANFVKKANQVLNEIRRRGKLPILVGGTGLYIKALIDGLETLSISPNVRLRKVLEAKSAEELFEILAQLNPIKAAALNYADRKNKRRLVRAIEVSEAQIRGRPKQKTKRVKDVLLIGLTASSSFLKKRIDRRVNQRLKKGLATEIANLLEQGVSWQMQSMTSMGYRQLADYYQGKIDKDEAVAKWKTEERKYAKRQLTWFKKDKRIIWFDVEDKNFAKRVEKVVDKWYKLDK